jgi:bifunctional non-homologous end joining protein LigD
VSSVPPADRRAAHWLDPLLVAEVTYSGWAADGRLRHPVWRGLRLDIAPESVIR